MRFIFLLLLAIALTPATAHANNKACGSNGPLRQIAYCGNFSSAPPPPPPPPAACAFGNPNFPACADSAACNFYVAATGGSDSNPGTVSSPFATLGKLQTALRGSVQKVGCLKAGNYTQSTTLDLTSSDNGETWEFDPAGNVNVAVVNGNNATPFAIDGVSNFKVNGIAVTNCSRYCFYSPSNPRITNIMFENNDIGHINSNCTPCGAIVLDNLTNSTFKNNYFHDSNSFGTMIEAFNAGDSLSGDVITGNVYINVCKQQSDCGAIYTNMVGTNTSGGNPTITNNFVRDQGSSSLTNDVVGIYLDDKTSNATVTGNIIGPPCAGCLNTGNRNNTTATLWNDDGNAAANSQNNVFTGNLIDIGSSAFEMTGILGGSHGTFTNNIVISNFTGPLNTSGGGGAGFAYIQDSGFTALTLKNNAYTNYAAGGSIFSNGSRQSDSSPQTLSTAQMGLTCTNGIYTLSASSSVFLSPVSFPGLPTSWGPPGFVIPPSPNHSCP